MITNWAWFFRDDGSQDFRDGAFPYYPAGGARQPNSAFVSPWRVHGRLNSTSVYRFAIRDANNRTMAHYETDGMSPDADNELAKNLCDSVYGERAC